MTSIRVIFSGAAPLGADLVATIRKRLQKVGSNAVVCQGASNPPAHSTRHTDSTFLILAYGLTETSPTMTILHPDDANTHIGSVGRVLPNIQVRLVHEDAGEVSV